VRDIFPSGVAFECLVLYRTLKIDKIQVVIYVQFRTLARIVGRICRSEDWGFVYLTGDTSLDHRTKAIKKFRDDPDVRILIAGLKCGGLGYVFFYPTLIQISTFSLSQMNSNIENMLT
jgi:hypothetical protein